MKLQRIKTDRADHLARISEGALNFKIVDGSIKGLDFEGPDGRIYVDLDSYALSISEAARKEAYYLGYFANLPGGENLFIEKYFDEEYMRQNFIDNHLHGYQADELVLEQRTIIGA